MEEPGRQSMGSRRVRHDWGLHFQFSLSCIGEGNGNPFQCTCLENPRDGGAWWAAIYGVAQSRTRLKQLSSSSKGTMAWWSQRGPGLALSLFSLTQRVILYIYWMLTHFTFFNPQNNPIKYYYILCTRKIKLREVHKLAQGHTVTN